MIQGCLFDMDGVLLDTERFGMSLLPEIAAQYGYTFTKAHYFSVLGVNHKLSRQILLDTLGADFPYEKIMGEFYEAFLTHARAGTLPVKDGAAECLRDLRAMGIRLALATSTARDIVDVYLQHIPALHGAFDQVVCGSDVGQSKPAPDIYLLAAEKLGLLPGECLGIEDSLNGLKSLTAAKVSSVMIPDMLPYDESLAPYITFRLSTLFELAPLVEKLRRAAENR